MAIPKQITFEGNKYNLGNKDRVAAHTALNGASIGAVTQSTDHTTEVTLNKQAGVITLAGVALNTNASAEDIAENIEEIRNIENGTYPLSNEDELMIIQQAIQGNQ